MGNKILMLISKSRYNALGSYSEQLGMCFEKMGYEVDYVDGNKDGYENHLYECTLNNEYFAVIACNAILTGYEKFIQKDSIFCCLMFDHPVHHHERLKIADGRTFVLHCDMKSAEYIARYYPNVGGVGFLPLSGKYIDDIKPFEERQYDIVFTGSNNNSDEIYETAKEQYGKMFEFFEKTTDILKSDVSLTIQEAFDEVLNNKGITLTDDEFAEVLKDFRIIDNYMRAWIREKVLSVINDAGYKIHVFGGGWDKFKCSHPENIIQMQGFGEDSLKVLADAKIALNVMPWFRGGFQERIASAQLCGAVALTDTSTYIDENFEDCKDIMIYDALRPETITERIKMILENEKIGKSIAEAGYAKAHVSHRWENRAEEIIENIKEMYGIINAGNKSSEPDVSIIVPVHNAEKTLVNTLNTVIRQTLNNIEIICVDDASTDNSLLILRECEKMYPDIIKIISLETSKGPGGARNEALKIASGKYIGFVDADDMIDEKMYAKMFKCAVEGDYDIVDTGYYREETDECKLYTADECTGILDDEKRRKLMYVGGGYIWSRIFKAHLFGRTPDERAHTFRENCILEDMDFMLDMIMKANSIGTVKEVLYVYKYYDNSASKNVENTFYRENATAALKACYNKLKDYENFENIRIAYEANVYRLYSWMLNQTIAVHCNKRIVAGNKIIQQLVLLKDGLVKNSFKENPYVTAELQQLDMDIMEQVDKLYHR